MEPSWQVTGRNRPHSGPEPGQALPIACIREYPSLMPLMSKKKQPFIIDENLSAALKPYLPG
jgi:hypothetical protein